MASPTERIIIEAAQRNMARSDIAIAAGVDLRRVYQVISDARRQGLDIPHAPRGPQRGDTRSRVHLGPDILERLRPHADLRGVDPRTLAAQIIKTIAKDDLVDAILDDLPQPERNANKNDTA